MKKTLICLSCVALFLAFTSIGYSQYPEDILRLSFPGLGVGARALGMGMAYTGVANDYTAAFWNPAGLGQIRMNELSFGLSNVASNNNATYLNNPSSFNNSSTSINDAGLVYPFPTEKGSLVFSVGYHRQADFASGLSFQGYNTGHSLGQFWTSSVDPYPHDHNMAYNLYLADSVNGKLVSRVKNNVTQRGQILNDGGLNNVALALASEAAPNLYLGISLNFMTGSYSYARNYFEDNLSDAASLNPYSLSLSENFNDDIGGFSATLGLIYKFNSQSRLGLTVRTPSWITVHETYSEQGNNIFDANLDSTATYISADHVKNDYDVTTPFYFSAGYSQGIKDLLLSAEVDYEDYTQMEFRNTNDATLLYYNTQIKQLFRPTVNMKIGGEYEFTGIGLRIRGGYAYLPSPYSGDGSSQATKYITGGIGYIFENSMAIDIGYAHGTVNTSQYYSDPWGAYRWTYDPTALVSESITTNNIIRTVTYRF